MNVITPSKWEWRLLLQHSKAGRNLKGTRVRWTKGEVCPSVGLSIIWSRHINKLQTVCMSHILCLVFSNASLNCDPVTATVSSIMQMVKHSAAVYFCSCLRFCTLPLCVAYIAPFSITLGSSIWCSNRFLLLKCYVDSVQTWQNHYGQRCTISVICRLDLPPRRDWSTNGEQQWVWGGEISSRKSCFFHMLSHEICILFCGWPCAGSGGSLIPVLVTLPVAVSNLPNKCAAWISSFIRYDI